MEDSNSRPMEVSGLLSQSYQTLEDSYEHGSESSFETRMPLHSSSPQTAGDPLSRLSVNSGSSTDNLTELLNAQKEVGFY